MVDMCMIQPEWGRFWLAYAHITGTDKRIFASVRLNAGKKVEIPGEGGYNYMQHGNY